MSSAGRRRNSVRTRSRPSRRGPRSKPISAPRYKLDTYRYNDGNEVLRAWIGIPLTVGIHDHKEGTIDALFSPALWNDDGLMSQAGEKVFFDRSTLYALRGAFAAGKTERAIELLKHHTNRRLLGSHVPYPIEWGLREASRTLPPGALYTAGFYGRSVWHSPHWFSFFCHCPKLAEGMGQHAIEKHTRVRQRVRSCQNPSWGEVTIGNGCGPAASNLARR